MKKIFVCLFKLHLKIAYFFIKLFPVNNKKIAFLSRQGNIPSIDFWYLKNKLLEANPNLKIVFMTKRMGKNIFSLGWYYLYLYKQMYHIATSNTCIIDTYIIPISILNHKKTLKVYQLWHAVGAIKKFGYQSLEKPSGKNKDISTTMDMHRNYTKLVTGSRPMVEFYAKAFGYKKEDFIIHSLPRMDYLINEKDDIKNRIIKEYPNLANKKNILYVPTFRTYKNTKVRDLLKCIDEKKYNFILKCHPVENIELENQEKYKYEKFNSLEFLTVADYIVTDYSGISMEGSVLDIPIYFYVYDYGKYEKNNGLNINLFKEMPGCVFKKEKDLINAIENKQYNFNTLHKYRKKYICETDGKSTEKLVKFIINNMNLLNEEVKNVRMIKED